MLRCGVTFRELGRAVFDDVRTERGDLLGGHPLSLHRQMGHGSSSCVAASRVPLFKGGSTLQVLPAMLMLSGARRAEWRPQDAAQNRQA